MTPRQLDRAVNAALSRILPPMVRSLRDDLVAELRQQLATRDEAPAAPVVRASEKQVGAPRQERATRDAAVAPKPEALPAEPPRQAVAVAGPWTLGEGSNRRLTEAGLARVAELLAEGQSDAQISKQLGITRRAVQLRRKNGTESGSPWAAIPQADRDQARAEKNREYQREWYRKRRAAQSDQERKAEPAPKAQTVAVVPAAVVPAPRIPPAPSALVMARHVPAVAARVAPPAPPKPQHAPNSPAPMDPAQLEPVPASYEDALDWLFAHLAREKMNTVEIEARLAALSTKQLLATCNAQRVKAGLSPYVLTERAA